MSKPENPQAFPSVFGPDGCHSGGLTMRDYFAAKAMNGYFSGDGPFPTGQTQKDLAVDFYAMADAMLETRMKP